MLLFPHISAFILLFLQNKISSLSVIHTCKAIFLAIFLHEIHNQNSKLMVPHGILMGMENRYSMFSPLLHATKIPTYTFIQAHMFISFQENSVLYSYYFFR